METAVTKQIARMLVWAGWRLRAVAQRIDLKASRRADLDGLSWWYAHPEHLKWESK
jgi:hypothetical protein